MLFITSDISACSEQKKFTKSRDISVLRGQKNPLQNKWLLFQHKIPASR